MNEDNLKNQRRRIVNECPSCGGTDIAMILWGLPNMDSKLEKKVKDKKTKKRQQRLEEERRRLSQRAGKGSFVVFREKGLEDVFVSDDL